MKTPTPAKVKVSAPDERISTASLSATQVLELRALIKSPITLEQVDYIARASNEPGVILNIRHRLGQGKTHLLCERVPLDGLRWRVVCRITSIGRKCGVEWLKTKDGAL